MQHTIQNEKKRYFIGLELRTDNTVAHSTIPAHSARFQNEGISAKIPQKINNAVIALYTDYESDHMGAYSMLLGHEVSSLDDVPAGLVGKIIPAASYAVFQTNGSQPEAELQVWGWLWKGSLSRSFTSDLVIYNPTNPKEVTLRIAIKK